MTGNQDSDVTPITMDELERLGIDRRTNDLYWDKRPVVLQRRVKLRAFEMILATAAAIGTFGTFCLELLKAFGVL